MYKLGRNKKKSMTILANLWDFLSRYVYKGHNPCFQGIFKMNVPRQAAVVLTLQFEHQKRLLIGFKQGCLTTNKISNVTCVAVMHHSFVTMHPAPRNSSLQFHSIAPTLLGQQAGKSMAVPQSAMF